MPRRTRFSNTQYGCATRKPSTVSSSSVTLPGRAARSTIGRAGVPRRPARSSGEWCSAPARSPAHRPPVPPPPSAADRRRCGSAPWRRPVRRRVARLHGARSALWAVDQERQLRSCGPLPSVGNSVDGTGRSTRRWISVNTGRATLRQPIMAFEASLRVADHLAGGAFSQRVDDGAGRNVEHRRGERGSPPSRRRPRALPTSATGAPCA